MKRRIHRVINFFAFNLLFFALYLNFIHKDSPTTVAGQSAQPQETTVVKKQENKQAVASSASVSLAGK